jgi:hypothetical protein
MLRTLVRGLCRVGGVVYCCKGGGSVSVTCGLNPTAGMHVHVQAAWVPAAGTHWAALLACMCAAYLRLGVLPGLKLVFEFLALHCLCH